MRVGANGRQTFQKCWLWSAGEEQKYGSGRKTSDYNAYNPLTDGPDFAACPKLPSGDELIKNIQACKEYLEVGIMFGMDPTKFLAEEKKISPKLKKQQQAARGIHPRDQHAMFIFTPTSKHIPTQANYFVGCRFDSGCLHPRRAPSEQVFFYSEFWEVVSDDMNKKQRVKDIAKGVVVEDDMAKLVTEHRLALTEPENFQNKIHLIWETFKMKYERTRSRDTLLLDALLLELDTVRPSQKYSVDTPTSGEHAFFHFDAAITDGEAKALIHEAKGIDPILAGLTPSLISAVHTAL
ncbi:uncharacterized protein FFB14_09009 [Fusarium fujikuroi]|nr:uncharacterized protein FFB14_09009 [Fusarium fujikuroi]